MLTLVGQDHTGIVAAVTRVLSDHDCMLGEASMMRLGGNFSMMMMVGAEASAETLNTLLNPIAHSMGLCVHVDAAAAKPHLHIQPNIEVRVMGADRAGIVSSVTSALADCEVNIVDLESDVIGKQDQPVYIMNILAVSSSPIETLQQRLQEADLKSVDVSVSAVETLIA